jgi:hypothetical protein
MLRIAKYTNRMIVIVYYKMVSLCWQHVLSAYRGIYVVNVIATTKLLILIIDTLTTQCHVKLHHPCFNNHQLYIVSFYEIQINTHSVYNVNWYQVLFYMVI